MNNIILIGMPGSGKSTIGVVLAKVLNYGFVDSDLLIQEQEGMCLHEIIEQKGLEEFKRIENQVNSNIVESKKVIATGGSAVYGKEAMEHLSTIGTVVYLKISCKELEERLGDLEERGVALSPEQTLSSLYEERCPLYEKYANITLECEGLSIEDAVRKLEELLEKNS